jgi:hypothetical protein
VDCVPLDSTVCPDATHRRRSRSPRAPITTAMEAYVLRDLTVLSDLLYLLNALRVLTTQIQAELRCLLAYRARPDTTVLV